MSLLSTIAAIEEQDDFHLARILVLLNAFAKNDCSGTLDGLTKLAKLDFLLRYPMYLERALLARKANPENAKVKRYERTSIESAMVRYKYGPWDFRYRRFINLLVSRNLAKVDLIGKTVVIGLTAEGIKVANEVSKGECFSDIKRRAKLLKQHFDLSGTNLKNFIYKTFPEIVSLKIGKKITL